MKTASNWKTIKLKNDAHTSFFFFIVFGLMGSPTKFGAGVVAKIFDLTAGKLVAPEQLLISPCSLAPESNMNVMRIKGNDRQLWKLFIVRQISLVITQQQPTTTTSLANSVMCFPN